MNRTLKYPSLLCGLIIGGALCVSGYAVGQVTPTPALPAATAPVATAAPVQPVATAPAPTPAFAPQPGQQINSAAWQALEPVREAISRRDYAAAQVALENARRVIPNDPTIAVYENMIRQATDPAAAPRAAGALLRTPRPGVTPLPVEATPQVTPEPVAEATPVSPAAEQSPGAATTDSSSGAVSSAKNLWDTNPLVKYGVFGVLALLLLFIVWMIMRRKKDDDIEPADISEEVTPVPGTLPSVSPMDFSVDELSAPSAPAGGFDFSPITDTSDLSPASGLSAMGSGAAADSPAFTTFGLDDEDHDVPAPAPVRAAPAPAPALDDDEPVRFHEQETVVGSADDSSPVLSDAEPVKFHDQETVISFDPAREPVSPAPVDSDMVSFGDIGLPVKQTTSSTPPASDLAPVEPQAKPTPKSHFTPTSAPGTVNLDDIFGAQSLPGTDAPEEDVNSQTVPTFVSKPGASDPLLNAETPPAQMRPESSGETSISFEELFGPKGGGDAPAPAEPTPAPATPPPPAAEVSIEDALAATLGAMQNEDPDAAPAPKPFAETTSTGGTESLDERTERMYNDQMEKARAAMAEKNWRQAVHVLSIASALHPEDEEARQMLREARAEKRKSEESV